MLERCAFVCVWRIGRLFLQNPACDGFWFGVYEPSYAVSSNTSNGKSVENRGGEEEVPTQRIGSRQIIIVYNQTTKTVHSSKGSSKDQTRREVRGPALDLYASAAASPCQNGTKHQKAQHDPPWLA